MLKKVVGIYLVFFLLVGATIAAEIQLGTPPEAPQDLTGLLLSSQQKAESEFAKVLQALPSINPQNREASRNFYNTYYSESGSQDLAWTGNCNTCAAGTSVSDFKDAVALRINYYWAMVAAPGLYALSCGLPPLVFFLSQADFSQAAVTMTENQQPITTALETVHNGYGENTLV